MSTFVAVPRVRQWLMEPDLPTLKVTLSPVTDAAREYFKKDVGREFEYPYKLKKASVPHQPWQVDLPFKDQDFEEELTPAELESFLDDWIAEVPDEELCRRYYLTSCSTVKVHVLLFTDRGRKYAEDLKNEGQ